MLTVLKHTLMITGFVAIMMLVVEYLNVLSQGQWQEKLSDHPRGQYLLAAFLGATPGCLGAFAIVSMYAHRRVSLGAVVAAMVATSGDEAYVLFTMIPRTALILTLLLFLIGIGAGIFTDMIVRKHFTAKFSCFEGMNLHEPEHCNCFDRHKIILQWKNCSPTRGILVFSLGLFLIALCTGQIGPSNFSWIRITLLTTTAIALFVAATVPDHFLEEHLWKHVIRGHVPRVFLWTFGALLIMHVFIEQSPVNESIHNNSWLMLGLAGIVGMIPESGPHMIFVTLFASGTIPFSVLLTSSIVQDGHGMLPMLAHSRRAFIIIKVINLAVGLVVGAVVMAIGH